jgi:hypothetical protein
VLRALFLAVIALGDVARADCLDAPPVGVTVGLAVARVKPVAIDGLSVTSRFTGDRVAVRGTAILGSGRANEMGMETWVGTGFVGSVFAGTYLARSWGTPVTGECAPDRTYVFTSQVVGIEPYVLVEDRTHAGAHVVWEYDRYTVRRGDLVARWRITGGAKGGFVTGLGVGGGAIAGVGWGPIDLETVVSVYYQNEAHLVGVIRLAAWIR